MWIFALYLPQKTTKREFLSENTREPSTILYTGNFERVALFIKWLKNKKRHTVISTFYRYTSKKY